MQKFTFALVCFVLLTAGCLKDDEPTPAINQLSRFDGWRLVSVESDFAGRVGEAVAALPDSTVEKSGLTRAEIRANYDARISATTGVEDCERDDVLFFDAGLVYLVMDGADCPQGSPTHVLNGFDSRRYSSDLAVTQLTLTNDDGTETTEYDVEELSDESLLLQQTRRVENNLILPPFTYSISYRFRAR